MKKFLTALAAGALLALGSAVPADAAPLRKPITPAGVKVKALKTAKTSKTAKKGNPDPGAITTKATACSSPCYKYAGGYQDALGSTSATGASAVFTVHKPTVRSWDYHSLAEIALSAPGTGGDNVVEAGWTVDPGLNGGSTDPHFFVYWWENGVGKGYNTADFLVSGTAPLTPGQNVNSLVGSTVTLKWEHFGAGCGCTQGWWLSNGASFIGVYPDTTWAGSAFTQVDLVRNFGEATLSQEPSQSQMGNGDRATSVVPAQGAQISSYTLHGTGAPAAGYVGYVTTTADRWNTYNSSATALRFGGPGGNTTINSTTAPSAQDCSGVGVGNDPSGWGAVCAYNSISAGVPVSKYKEIDGAAGASCRTGWQTPISGTLMITNTSYKRIQIFPNGTCTGGTSYTITGVGRVTMPAPYNTAAALSLIVTSTYVTCATGYPTTAPTC